MQNYRNLPSANKLSNYGYVDDIRILSCTNEESNTRGLSFFFFSTKEGIMFLISLFKFRIYNFKLCNWCQMDFNSDMMNIHTQVCVGYEDPNSC